MSKGTTHRTVRIEDGLWGRAKATADRRGDNLSDVLRRALELYAEDQHPTMSSEVSAKNNAHIANCPQCQVTFG